MKLENHKQIDAPPAVVWAVTEDVERWPEWTPTVQSAQRLDDGPFDVGSKARIKQPGLPETEWTVTSLSRGNGFTWETRVRGMHLVATHALAPSGVGTNSTLHIEMSGVAAVLLWPLIRSSASKSLERENAALKAACEAAAGSA